MGSMLNGTTQKTDATDAPLDEAEPRGQAVSGRLLAVLIVVAMAVIAVTGWVWLDIRGTRALPGTPLTIRTEATSASGSACGSQVIPPARLLVVGDALTLIAADGGADIPVTWPAGYAAREDQGIGGLYDPTGYVVARENQNILERFYGAPGSDGTFHVCRITRD